MRLLVPTQATYLSDSAGGLKGLTARFHGRDEWDKVIKMLYGYEDAAR